MPCLPGFWPVMKPVQETLEITGIDERMGASVPLATSSPKAGMTPRATRSRTSGRPTPSRPRTATRDAGPAAPPPRRNRSRRPSLDLLLRHAHDLRDRGGPDADRPPAVLAQGAHRLLHRRVADQVGR